MRDFAGHFLYFLAWASFGAGHSLLAANAVKARLAPCFGAGYRLAYNGFAGLHLLAVLAAGWWLLGDGAVFARPVWVQGVQGVMVLVGLVVLAVGLAGYDLGRFGGTSQLRAARRGETLTEDEELRLDGLHRWVRHPLYAGALLAIWGRVVDELSLATAVWATLYFLIGMAFEERKLVALYGDAYRDYRRRVPALVPWRGRAP